MVETGKTRLHSMESRSALERSSPAARSRSCAYSSKKPGPAEGGVPARCVFGSDKSAGWVTQAYQSEARSSHCSAGSEGQPISTWKPAMAVPKRNPRGNSTPLAQAHINAAIARRFIAWTLPAFALAAASGILPACREKLQPGSVAGVEVSLPAWKARSEKDDAASGYIERADGSGSRAGLAWDIDPRPGPVTESAARAAAGLRDAEATPTAVAGHEAVLLRNMKGSALVWRCDKTMRLFRLFAEGPRSPDVAELAAHAHCHAERMLTNGDVPAVASSGLGPDWRFASRGRGSISWIRDDAVMTLFAGQATPAPRD